MHVATSRRALPLGDPHLVQGVPQKNCVSSMGQRVSVSFVEQMARQLHPLPRCRAAQDTSPTLPACLCSESKCSSPSTHHDIFWRCASRGSHTMRMNRSLSHHRQCSAPRRWSNTCQAHIVADCGDCYDMDALSVTKASTLPLQTDFKARNAARSPEAAEFLCQIVGPPLRLWGLRTCQHKIR
eukprot:SAG31_NODE_4275_length_3387_cov_1.686740_1_plen_183_part_00